MAGKSCVINDKKNLVNGWERVAAINHLETQTFFPRENLIMVIE